ncbi:hypothetical protein GPLA_4624 [Paraglaciecola polaris LMG 21857]|uniref:Uncharacterized protein n=1 Tax=Paraglaciecola polaris LMG 21857 TaxID=1129793 RepID=K7A3M2_9ALTE|nr:hypothetical protein GPLA_4624 [Paraglaciecola polaris LMG 21857]
MSYQQDISHLNVLKWPKADKSKNSRPLGFHHLCPVFTIGQILWSNLHHGAIRI